MADFITVPEETFIRELLRGHTTKEAYKIAFKEQCEQMDDEEIAYEARKLSARRKIQRRRLELMQEMQDELKETRKWEFANSVQQLRYAMDEIQYEVERIKQASQDEIDALFAKADREENKAKRERILDEINKKMKYKHLTQTQMQSMIMAVAELNKMHGFNQDNFNFQGTVSFVGEDELED